MSFYARFLLPRLIDAGMKYGEMTRLRQRVVPSAGGVVLEIGIGSGLNLPYYTPAVTKLYGLEPSAELLAMARTKIAPLPFPVVFLHQDAARLPLADASVDTIVLTWTLCSIAEAGLALAEMRRVLTPGGALLFVEHGLAPDAGVRTWQNRLTPIWRRVGGGCHLNRRPDDLLRAAGFTLADLRTAYVPGPRVTAFMYEGRAVPGPDAGS